jgi:membrane-bound inhibitor of C-type lysozyme
MRFLSIVLIFFLSACAQLPIDDIPALEQSNDANLSFKYLCESEKTIVVAYPTDSTAVVEYDSRHLQMKIAVSGSGARYVGERLEWWTKGSGQGASGTLFRHLSGGISGEVIEQCVQTEN